MIRSRRGTQDLKLGLRLEELETNPKRATITSPEFCRGCSSFRIRRALGSCVATPEGVEPPTLRSEV